VCECVRSPCTHRQAEKAGGITRCTSAGPERAREAARGNASPSRKRGSVGSLGDVVQSPDKSPSPRNKVNFFLIYCFSQRNYYTVGSFL